jgi:titin
MAENAHGIGEPVQTEDAVKAIEVPDYPEYVEVADVGTDSVTLKWQKPESDGGSKITGYLVESLEKSETQWTKRAQVAELKATVTGLSSKEEYNFRVTAINEAGASEPSEIPNLIIISDSYRSPQINATAFPQGNVHIRVGLNLDIDVPCSGKPAPNIRWLKDGEPLKNTDKLSTAGGKAGVAHLQISEVKQSHQGSYEIVAENSVGKANSTLNVITLD